MASTHTLPSATSGATVPPGPWREFWSAFSANRGAVIGLATIVVLLLGFIVQGSTEEIFFRGWLMQLIASRHGLWLAIGINSVLFGLMHAANIPPSRELFMGLLNIALFGVFISLYAAREGSLWGVCGWHAAWNWLLGLGFGLVWPRDVFPYLWFWQELHGSRGYPWYGRVYVMGLEPWTSYPGHGLTSALARGTARRLEPGQSLTADLQAVLYESRTGVRRIHPDGTVEPR